MFTATRLETTTTPDGRTIAIYSIELPAREDIGGALELEQDLQRQLNKVGAECLAEALACYDTEGEPIELGNLTLTSKGRSPQSYLSLFGPLSLERHIYQSSAGGRTYCPLEQRARIQENATLGLCHVLASKYADLSGRVVRRHMELSHQLDLELSRIQDICDVMGKRALGKEEHWTYKPAAPSAEVHAITVYMDGTTVPIVDEKHKIAMVGAIDLLGDEGQRLATVHIAQAPQEGKSLFFERMERELAAIHKLHPDTITVGLSDGAPDLQEWLEAHCDWATLDFYHLSQYVCKMAPVFTTTAKEAAEWTQQTLHNLKHHQDAHTMLERQLTRALKREDLPAELAKDLRTTHGYVLRNLERIQYKTNRNLNLPIGSGVIEGACKHIVKARVCGSGMRWKRSGIQGVLALRSLQESTGRWSQFWNKVQALGW
jgi:hypothetical protein